MGFLQDILGGGVAKVVSSIGETIDTFVLTKEEKEKLKLETQKLVNEQMNIIAQDISNARNLQVEALKQEDKVAKRFIYYYSWFWSFVCVAYIGGITFVPLDESKNHIVDTILGFLLGTLVASIITYFYGSSAGAAKNREVIQEIAKSKSQ